ncbi:hypothetical protein IV73_GL000688 [Weissella kandleri]|uniref:Accessory secretory protein Asp1 n=1 Tax=Weissella kandleri TaxID=1616 RepID=A0A0R2JGE3_9LACO|nr:hypothetical protein [Weissella kandleri]KRN74934.1 hypothetical protein IV73_GL000688 [Weissella kandleri]
MENAKNSAILLGDNAQKDSMFKLSDVLLDTMDQFDIYTLNFDLFENVKLIKHGLHPQQLNSFFTAMTNFDQKEFSVYNFSDFPFNKNYREILLDDIMLILRPDNTRIFEINYQREYGLIDQVRTYDKDENLIEITYINDRGYFAARLTHKAPNQYQIIYFTADQTNNLRININSMQPIETVAQDYLSSDGKFIDLKGEWLLFQLQLRQVERLLVVVNDQNLQALKYLQQKQLDLEIDLLFETGEIVQINQIETLTDILSAADQVITDGTVSANFVQKYFPKAATNEKIYKYYPVSWDIKPGSFMKYNVDYIGVNAEHLTIEQLRMLFPGMLTFIDQNPQTIFLLYSFNQAKLNELKQVTLTLLNGQKADYFQKHFAFERFIEQTDVYQILSKLKLNVDFNEQASEIITYVSASYGSVQFTVNEFDFLSIGKNNWLIDDVQGVFQLMNQILNDLSLLNRSIYLATLLSQKIWQT